MKISVLHPSRQRAATAGAAISEWLGKRSGRHSVEYLLSVDTGDEQLADYVQLAGRHGIRLIVHPNRNLVAACNRAARLATGELLVLVSDDVGCPPRWDDALALALGDRSDVVVQVDDGLGARTMALPIVGRAFYQQRGYLLFPRYVHHFSQDDLAGLARRLGKLVDARHLRFPHRHYTAGASAYDQTSRHADRSWKQGAHLLRKREARDFGLRAPKLGTLGTCAVLDLDYQWRGMKRVLRRAGRRAKRTFSVLDRLHYRWLGLFHPNLASAVRPTVPLAAGEVLGFHCYVADGQVQGDGLLLEHATAPSQIICLRDCVLDRSRVRVRAGGREMPTRPFPLEWEFAAWEKGSLLLRDLRGLKSDRLRGYLRRCMSSLELVANLCPGGEETVTTFAIERWDYANFSHLLFAVYNTYVAVRLLGRSAPFNLLFLDGHCRSSLDPFWSDVLQPAQVRRLHDYPGEKTLFRQLVLVPSEHDSPLWYTAGAGPSQSGDFLADFSAAVLAAYQVVDQPAQERVLTLVDRRDYRADPQSDGTVCRKLDDLDSTLAVLRRLYPQHRLEVRCFESMPFREQLQIVRQSDVLCGIHGAALTHVMFMRPGSELVEFSPPEFLHRNLFPDLARAKGVRYARYVAQTDQVLANGRHVVRVTDQRLI
jgi:glycosyltransferase involved in cell wall biosynthesis